MNKLVCQGQFSGGEIEPGTFHTCDVQNCLPSEEKTRSMDSQEIPYLDDEYRQGIACLGVQDDTEFYD